MKSHLKADIRMMTLSNALGISLSIPLQEMMASTGMDGKTSEVEKCSWAVWLADSIMIKFDIQ